MQVEIGPVPSSAVQAWVNYGREVLVALRGAAPGEVPPRVLDRFATYLDEWSAQSRRDATFRWVGEASPEVVEYLINALYVLGERVEEEAEEGRMRLRPPEADKFHIVLVNSVLEALAHEGPSQAQFVEQMRARWEIARLGG